MRWWTSDWHLNHGNIITFCDRPFTQPPAETGYPEDAEPESHLLAPDVEKMNKALIDNFNDLVGPGDEAWFVGDLAMGRREAMIPLFKQLRCRNLYCVPGNHDACHKMHPDWRKHQPMYEAAGFTVLDSQVTTEVGGTEVLVCHFPYTGDSKFDDRFTGLRPDDEGGWLIHGHSHSEARIRDRQLHVGVDAWAFKPASEDEIIALMQR